MSPKIQITARGIRAALKRYTPLQSIAEYIWNGFDAQATSIEIIYTNNELGGIDSITIKDNGYGIPHSKLQEKFEPVFESKKSLQTKLKKNISTIHGKNGIGRLTFFTFARNAYWKTTYKEGNDNFTYDIYANAENINLYTGINTIPKKVETPIGTEILFSGVHSLTKHDLESTFLDFLLKEFSWFLALNSKRNFSIIINGTPLDYKNFIEDKEDFEILHEKTSTKFSVNYIRWKDKLLKEPSKYYYINSDGKEQWKESSIIKNKGDRFYHSIFIQSEYFNSFGFQSNENDIQNSLITGTRSDSQFRFMRKKIANFLRVKRRPFLKEFAKELILEYKKNNIISSKKETEQDSISNVIKILYEMQPKLFSSLNIEQKKMLVGLLELAISSDKKGGIPEIIGTIIDLEDQEKEELATIFSENIKSS